MKAGDFQRGLAQYDPEIRGYGKRSVGSSRDRDRLQHGTLGGSQVPGKIGITIPSSTEYDLAER